MDNLVANHGVRRTLHAADLEAAHKAGQPAIVADVEGLDFLGGKLARPEEARQLGRGWGALSRSPSRSVRCDLKDALDRPMPTRHDTLHN